MTATPQNDKDRRRIFMILSPRSWPYAELCIRSLFCESANPLDVSFFTDSRDDKNVLEELLLKLPNPSCHRWIVEDDASIELRSAELWGDLPNLQAFRRGHPCWRKVTDPLLFTDNSDEMVILDPDVYFPNRFTFEVTPDQGILLMWQQPNCLLPAETVQIALKKSIPLARHVDIGVAAWRAGIDLEWVDWLIAQLGGTFIPRIMHVESILWSALAMKFGGGHLDPNIWRCWRRTQTKRILLKLGLPDVSILRSEPFAEIKCFHAGGEAKWWIRGAAEAGMLERNGELLEPCRIQPLTELTPTAFKWEQRIKGIVRNLGYYSILGKS
jgi:hypothetical protein